LAPNIGMINIENKAEIKYCLAKLQPGQQPLFGKMGPQHMVEHLIDVLRISNGKVKFHIHTPEEKLENYVKFLFSDKEMPVGFKAPFIGEEPSAIIYPDLETAKEVLLNEVETFFNYYAEEPLRKEMHPIFGPLNKTGWLMLHGKHFRHHFKQFDLL
jgi:hydroxymethylglutaryl-CoA reductase